MTRQYYLELIISGGQTGVDRAALDVALDRGITAGGWCPLGRRAEDGIIPDRYPLTETTRANYFDRTKKNILESDGTLILNVGQMSSGTLATYKFAKRKKPCLVIQLDEHKTGIETEIIDWLKQNNIRKLNVAGPREAKAPGINKKSYDLLTRVVERLQTG